MNTVIGRSEELQKSLIVGFFFQHGDDPFIFYVNGMATVDSISQIEIEAIDVDACGGIFNQGDGEYFFDANLEPGQYDHEGRCEMAPYWDLALIEYRKL